MKTLIIGGARSGKSAYAEQIVLASQLEPLYIATASAHDDEMEGRIHLHQQRRGDQWQTIEEPLFLTETLKQHSNERHYILVDCLTLWLTNLQGQLWHDDANASVNEIENKQDELCDSITELAGKIIFVSNEVGQGIVPMGELSRQFCDLSGRLHQRIAKQCDQVIHMIAGIPQIIKG